MTVYLAIFKALNGDEFVIEYRPLYDVLAGAIEVLSIEVKHHPVNWQEQRAEYVATATRTPTIRLKPDKPRQLDLFE